MADLDAIERDWKDGKLSNVAVATRHGVTEGYIRKVAKKFNWTRGAAPTPPPPPPPPKTLMRRDAPATAGMDDPTLANNLLRRMLDELDTVTSHIGELEELIELETGGDRDDRRRAAMMKAVSLPVRANTLKMLLAAQAEADEGKKGKKEQQKDKAKGAAAGRFAPAVAPGLRAVV